MNQSQHLSAAHRIAETFAHLAHHARKARPHLNDALGVEPNLAGRFHPHLDRGRARRAHLNARGRDGLGGQLDPSLALFEIPIVPLAGALQRQPSRERMRLFDALGAMEVIPVDSKGNRVPPSAQAIEDGRETFSSGTNRVPVIVVEVRLEGGGILLGGEDQLEAQILGREQLAPLRTARPSFVPGVLAVLGGRLLIRSPPAAARQQGREEADAGQDRSSVDHRSTSCSSCSIVTPSKRSSMSRARHASAVASTSASSASRTLRWPSRYSSELNRPLR